VTRLFVAIGGNIEPERRVPQAAGELRRRFPGMRFSRCYRNPAYGFAGADFYNAVAEADTALPLSAVQAQLQEVEALCGRSRSDAKWAARAMDLDLLLFGDLVLKTERCELPRPDLLRRAYMLAPLAELAPQQRHPLTARTLSEHWRELAAQPHELALLDLDLNARASTGP
jgi:2-amino-4-hydroxy-6-hydroxymethyldihydropteridine diphosphokinase